MENEKREFYIIPKEIFEDKSLTPNEKLLYCRLSAFKKVWVSNEWVAERFGVSETWASRMINSLIKKGYLEKIGFNGRFRQLKVNLDLNNTNEPAKEVKKAVVASKKKDNTTPVKEIIDFWLETTQLPLKSGKYASLERTAICNLYKKYGAEQLYGAIQAVAYASMDKYAPKISNFLDLQEKWADLVLYIRKKGNEKKTNKVSENTEYSF